MSEQSAAEDDDGDAEVDDEAGDVDEGRERLLVLIGDHPDDQVAAYQQLGQSYTDSGEVAAAAAVLRTGITKAKASGDWHAAAEMQQMLDSLE